MASAGGRFGFICAPSTSRGHADERAGYPLHSALDGSGGGNPFKTLASDVQTAAGIKANCHKISCDPHMDILMLGKVVQRAPALAFG